MKTKDNMGQAQPPRTLVGTQNMSPRERQDVRMEVLATEILEKGLGRRRWASADRDKIAEMIDSAIDEEILLRGYVHAAKPRRRKNG